MISPASFDRVSPASFAPPRNDIADLVSTNRTAFGDLDVAAVAKGIVDRAGGDSAQLDQLTSEAAGQFSPLEQGNWLDKIIQIIRDLIKDLQAPLPPKAADSANAPDLEAIANDPAVRAAINSSWSASNPNTPGDKHETGFWVVRDNATGELSTIPFPSNGTRDSLTPGPVPNEPGKTVVAFFHTHPNTTGEGYVSGPSPADQAFADANGIPGIIRSHDGMYYFNPK